MGAAKSNLNPEVDAFQPMENLERSNPDEKDGDIPVERNLPAERDIPVKRNFPAGGVTPVRTSLAAEDDPGVGDESVQDD